MEKQTNETKQERTTCEMCGKKLVVPETDDRNAAVCKACLKGQEVGEVEVEFCGVKIKIPQSELRKLWEQEARRKALDRKEEELNQHCEKVITELLEDK